MLVTLRKISEKAIITYEHCDKVVIDDNKSTMEIYLQYNENFPEVVQLSDVEWYHCCNL